MGKGRTLNKKPMTRPTKKAGERRNRDKAQKKRLIALGVAPEATRTMTTKDIRTLLKRPKKIATSTSP